MIDLEYSQYVVSVAYGRYISGVGGTDKAILSQQRLFNKNKISYFYIYPVKRLNRFIRFEKGNIWGLIVDGNDAGLFTTNALINGLDRLEKSGYRIKAVFIHHLLRVTLDELSKILSCIESNIYFYLHDYMTICPSGGLITSEDVYCGASFPNKEKCRSCKLALPESEVYKTTEFVKKISERATFIVPSDAAREEWLKAYDFLGGKVKVIYHQIPTGNYSGNMDLIKEDEALKVAFVGYKKNLKGWIPWKDAIFQVHEKNLNIHLYQFGRTDEHFDFVEEVSVDFKKDSEAMTKALREKGIHCAVLWSLWPETYSYTYYEAWAANAFILTNNLSGNIAVQTEKNKNGIVADSPESLKNLLCDISALKNAVNAYRKKSIKGPKHLLESTQILGLIKDDVGSIVLKNKLSSDLICIKVINFLYALNRMLKNN